MSVVEHLAEGIMGNLCKGSESDLSSVADPVSGLKPREIELIKELWISVYDQVNFKEIGVLFFLKLFQKHPYMKAYFPKFANVRWGDLDHFQAFREHATSVFAEISKYVDCVEDSDTLVSLISKRTKGHFIFGVTAKDMENMKEVILEFLAERGEGMNELDQALAAWEKLLNFHNIIFHNSTNEFVMTSRNSIEALKPGRASTMKEERPISLSLDQTTTISQDQATTLSQGHATSLSHEHGTTISHERATTVSHEHTTTINPDLASGASVIASTIH